MAVGLAVVYRVTLYGRERYGGGKRYKVTPKADAGSRRATPTMTRPGRASQV